MIEYIVSSFALFTLYRGVRIILGKDRDPHPKHRMKGADPIYIKGGKVGVLMIHGFTSTPYDFREFAQFMGKKGYSVSVPLLKGHGTSPENLATTNSADWMHSVERAFDKLRKDANQVFVIGSSFGGNLAILLAAHRPTAGIICLGTPIYFRQQTILRIVYPVMRVFKTFKKKVYPHLDEEVIKHRVTYNKIPLNVIPSVVKVVNQSRVALPAITCPTLVMQSTNDYGIHERSANIIFESVAAKIKRMVWVHNAYHVFLIDKHKTKAFRDMYQFIKDCEKRK